MPFSYVGVGSPAGRVVPTGPVRAASAETFPKTETFTRYYE
jgi:hypothetical protein